MSLQLCHCQPRKIFVKKILSELIPQRWDQLFDANLHQTLANLEYFESQQKTLYKRLATTEKQLEKNDALFEKLEDQLEDDFNLLTESDAKEMSGPAREQIYENMKYLGAKEKRLNERITSLKTKIGEFAACAAIASFMLFA